MNEGTGSWIVAVGASGIEGLHDIHALLKALPLPLRAAILVVLHRPWDKQSNLQSVLARDCLHPVLIADEGERFVPGKIYIGEPSQHLTLVGQSFNESVDDPSRFYRNRTSICFLARLLSTETGG